MPQCGFVKGFWKIQERVSKKKNISLTARKILDS